MKLKLKSIGKKVQEHNVSQITNFIEQPEVKEKKVKISAKKVVYISKRGSKAIFDSIGLCAKIFGKDPTTIKYRIEHPNVRASLDFDWLEGGRLEYLK